MMTTPTKVTREHLGKRIVAADYVVMPDGRTTVCQLTMQNGFTVRGESSCVSVENFNKELGEKYAYEKAFDAAWAFEGYLLAELRHREARGDENRHREEQEKARRDVLLALMDMLMVSDTDALLRRVTALREAHAVVGSFGWALEATRVDNLEDALYRINAWRDAYIPPGSFGWALEQLKAGKRVARKGWNGKGMWLMKIQGSNDIAKLHGYGFGEVLGEPTFADTVIIRTPGHMLVAWNASQQDMLADDWVVVE